MQWWIMLLRLARTWETKFIVCYQTWKGSFLEYGPTQEGVVQGCGQTIKIYWSVNLNITLWI